MHTLDAVPGNAIIYIKLYMQGKIKKYPRVLDQELVSPVHTDAVRPSLPQWASVEVRWAESWGKLPSWHHQAVRGTLLLLPSGKCLRPCTVPPPPDATPCQVLLEVGLTANLPFLCPGQRFGLPRGAPPHGSCWQPGRAYGSSPWKSKCQLQT